MISATVPGIRVGDELVAIDGVDAMHRRSERLATLAGSPQFHMMQAHERLTEGPVDSRIKLRVRRGAQLLDVEAMRNGNGGISTRAAIAQLDGNVYYVDLSRVTRTELEPIMPKLASASGVVFDMRERPRDGEYVLSHLLTRPMGDEKWAAIPHIIRPDHVSHAIRSGTREGWNLPMLAPRIAGKVAFISGPSTMSLPEVFLGYIAGYKLGEIVGRTSGGTNGDKASLVTPSGCLVTFTGMKVTKLDGSQMLMSGFAPTIPVTKTEAGVIAGRDEELERALEYIQTGY